MSNICAFICYDVGLCITDSAAMLKLKFELLLVHQYKTRRDSTLFEVPYIIVQTIHFC